MDIKIYARNLELNGHAEDYIRKKLNRLERHLRPISDAKLELTRTSARSQDERIVAQMTLYAGRHILRGEESGLNLFAAVDAVADVMDRQIQRFKEKVYRTAQARKAARATALADTTAEVAPGLEDVDEVALHESGRVVRTKRFPMTPMTVEDAILQMELLAHDFFLFYNIDTSEYNVVYRRRDGDYGVIEPELV